MADKLLRFTSRNHITTRWLRNNPNVIIECWYCGKPIHKDDPKRKYCNNSCKKKYWRASRKTVTYGNCEWCNKLFELTRSDKRYCSKRCIMAADRFRRGIPVMGIAKDQCKHCAIVFTRQKPAQKYCSFDCFFINRMINKNRYYHRKNPNAKKRRSKYNPKIHVTAEEISLAHKNIKVAETGADYFDEDDWNRRAKEAEDRILAKYG